MTTQPAPVRDRAAARSLLRRLDEAATWHDTLGRAAHAARRPAVALFHEVRERMVWTDLAAMPLDKVKEVTKGRLRLGLLAQHGYGTVAQVLRAGPRQLMAVPGVGENTARGAYAAAEQLQNATRESIRFRIDVDPGDKTTTQLLQALWVWGAIRKDVETGQPAAAALERELNQLRRAARPAAAGPLRRLFMAGARKSAAEDALAAVAGVLQRPATVSLGEAVARVQAAPGRTPGPRAVWRDFERRSAEYYGLLAGLVDVGQDADAAEGFLPAEIIAQINAQPLDDSRLRVSLRGYQSFGARFAIVQRRVLIGDEMGLGKTIQAIAAMAHLAASGKTHFLVVCPASVMINWSREIEAHSDLAVLTLHGAERDRLSRVWRQRGAVAVTTFETLSTLDITGVRPAMLVVDEAHYAKNPQAKRTQAVARVAEASERVLFLSGTPMENKVEEFRSLVKHLQPRVAQAISSQKAVVDARTFRSHVAPVYLRRNQQDVLTELPELVQVEEWEEFGAQDGAAYREAVRDGNFMAMRRAAFAVRQPRSSAKLKRLLEIAHESVDNGHKVVVFSFFRDVIDTVAAALGDLAYGPVTGSLPVAARQKTVDEFTESPSPGVLVSQIEAGGVGLNIQAASVVILCEPQVKPTTEAQAIARAHRMGQVRTVQVHRLLIADSVDQRLLEILGHKRLLFDAYVRDSAVAASAPGAVDISEAKLARMIVEQEQERLAVAATGARPLIAAKPDIADA